jgi:hypothetical protein
VLKEPLSFADFHLPDNQSLSPVLNHNPFGTIEHDDIAVPEYL